MSSPTISLLGNEWIRVSKKHSTKIETTKVYYRYIHTKHKSMKLTISIGNDIGNLLGWKKGDYVTIDYSRLRPLIFRVARSTDTDGDRFKLHQSGKSHSINITFKMKPGLSLNIDTSTPIYFDFDHNDLMLDLSRKHQDQYVSLRQSTDI